MGGGEGWRNKAVEGHRTPRRWRDHDDARLARSVLECASPLALGADGAAADLNPVGICGWSGEPARRATD